MALQRMYCPECGNYLLNPVGDCNDCYCGYRQPIQQEESEEVEPADCKEANAAPKAAVECEDGLLPWSEEEHNDVVQRMYLQVGIP